MKIKNHTYYMAIDNLGIKFKHCQNNSIYRIQELNELGLRFVMAITIRHELTDLPITIAIFEEILEK